MNVKPSLASGVAALMTVWLPVLAQRPPVEIPFEFVRNQVLVQVRIDGKGPFVMMLDTGTDPSVVDLATADAIGIARSGKGQVGSGGGTDKNLAFECKLQQVELGGLKAGTVAAAAMDLSKISDRMGTHVDGVLGHSLLNKRIVQFDYPHRIVRFLERGPAATSGASVLKFRYADNLLIDDVWINGVKVVGNVDTGSSGTFALTPRAVGRLGLANEVEKAPVQTSVGFNGTYEHRVGKVSRIKVGTFEVRDADITFFGAGTGYDKRPWDVNIGNQFMKDYVVTIDYLKKTVTFEKP